MERSFWTDERLNESFDRLMRELTEFRAEMSDSRTEVLVGFAGVNSRLDSLDKRMDETGSDLREVRAQLASLNRVLVGGVVVIVAALISLQL